MHAVAFAASWYEPAGQTAHCVDLKVGAKLPGLHTDGAVTPVPHALPGGQCVHAAASPRSVAVENVPARHGRAAAADLAQ